MKEMIEQYISSKSLFMEVWIFIQNLIFVGTTICIPNIQLTGCRHTLAVDSKNPHPCSDIYRLLDGLMRECGTGVDRGWGNHAYTPPGGMLQIRINGVSISKRC